MNELPMLLLMGITQSKLDSPLNFQTLPVEIPHPPHLNPRRYSAIICIIVCNILHKRKLGETILIEMKISSCHNDESSTSRRDWDEPRASSCT